ncbi:MAG: hypothetical protein WAZ99_08475 [Rectinemataceae bacterium]
MTFGEKMKSFLEKSLDVSKDALNKAGAQAQTWGEMGKLRVEILQLHSKAQKLTGQLGAETYELLVEKGEPMIGAYTEGIAGLIDQIKTLEKDIDEKELAFHEAGGKDSDLDGDGKPD